MKQRGGKLMTKKEREEREYKSLFGDERYAKKAWRTLMAKSLESEAATPPEVFDNKGNETLESQIYRNAYDTLTQKLKAEGKDRKPMKAEIIVESNLIRAAFDTSTFNVILDRTAGKVKEEINIGMGQYEELSDEELEVLASHRQARLKEGKD